MEKKGEEIIVLNLKKFHTITDYFIICTASSEKHAQAIADNVLNKVPKGEFLGMEGYNEGKWILIDCGDVIVHIFQKETREFYDLEGLWFDAEKLNLKDYGL